MIETNWRAASAFLFTITREGSPYQHVIFYLSFHLQLLKWSTSLVCMASLITNFENAEEHHKTSHHKSNKSHCFPYLCRYLVVGQKWQQFYPVLEVFENDMVFHKLEYVSFLAIKGLQSIDRARPNPKNHGNNRHCWGLKLSCRVFWHLPRDPRRPLKQVAKPIVAIWRFYLTLLRLLLQ